jgi:Tannase-like family of unknown function (DUF6351)
MKQRRSAMTLRAATIAAVAVVLMALPAAQAKNDRGHDFEITTLSSRPDTVTGGDAVVEIKLPRYARQSDLVVELNGKDVTSLFTDSGSGRRLTGLVTGLREGENRLTVGAKHHHHNQFYEKLELINYPGEGPVFSGPRETPWICETEASGLGLPPASGPCVVLSRTDWFYRTSAGTFQPLPSLAPPYPADLVQTTTIDGKTVNYIVRVESGTINESIYRIAIIDDPANPITNPWSPGGKKPGPGWNGKLTWPFGGGCSAGFRSGSNSVTTALRDTELSLGFAVAFGTRNTLGTGCNDVVSAETLMMIKERFIEGYGLPKFTIGSGGSGGAIQQHLITHNYPGLLDALTPNISYPDLGSIAIDVMDCKLLYNYFENIANPGDWPGTRRAKVDGYAVATQGANEGNTACNSSWLGFADGWQNPTNSFSSVVPVEARYDPVTNPTGARGTFWDSNVNAFGKYRNTGFARSPYDNVGVQYGLNALNNGDITVDEFLDINENVGGLDIDGNIVPTRTSGDLKAIENGYRTGRFVTSGKNLTLPIIDTRDYRDILADIHTRERTLMFLERLQKANGTTANQVNWLTARDAGQPDLARMALLAHNEWLENIQADTSHASYRVKVIRNKPKYLKDACWVNGEKIEEPVSWDPSTACNQAMPVHMNVRLAAGGSRAGDVIKCRLKKISFSDYNVAFNEDQKQRLQAIFTEGVCDWSKRGIGQESLEDTWLAFPRPGHSVSLDDLSRHGSHNY